MRVVTGKVRLSYAYVWEKRKNKDGSDGKYTACLLIPKKDKETIRKIETAIKEALEEGKSKKFGGVIPKVWKNPLHDGDAEKESEEYEGCMYINAGSFEPVKIVDSDKNEIFEKDEVYSGCYAKVIMDFYPYNNESKGVGCGLKAIMKVADGERLGGGSVSLDEFGDYDNDDDTL